MSETADESNSFESEKPAQVEDVKFPPFPDPKDSDFDEDLTEEEKNYYKTKFKDLNTVASLRLHCTACDRHLGCSSRHEGRMRMHPMLRTLVCNTCHAFYNSGEFEKGDDGSELYCRWCGQGGQVYCCSECPHVFCAKCIKRNLGLPKIKEIENTDDWKCFKCNNKSLWDLRSLCWALMRYCDLKNRITLATQDPDLKDTYQKYCGMDSSECCKSKRRREKTEQLKKKETETSAKKAATAAAISKIPPTIQVKKFASISIDESKQEKKAVKRSASPKCKPVVIKNPMTIATSNTKVYNAVSMPNILPKKMRLPNSPVLTPVRFADRKSVPQYSRIRMKPPQMPIPIMNTYNGFNNNPVNFTNLINDNINLSLESLTQGLDMAAVASMGNNIQDDAVVCTPDFPLEPLCEVTEDNTDDDVQCITPGPVAVPKIVNPPPLVPRSANSLPDLTAENIIQMTENDVTVNATTGGLKFRVDPQTLSSNKMYRLPDGRIFAINSNPNMPGGYSATIVAITETAGKVAPKGATYAAKLSAVPSQMATPPPLKVNRNSISRSLSSKRNNTSNSSKVTRGTETTERKYDLNVPVEWYRYNLIDAVDALEYSLSRLNKIKKNADTAYLRARSVSEMRALHKTLERLLNTSSTRFKEIRDNLNDGLKQYLAKKANRGNTATNISDDEDDDVEILPDNDDPIFIDENSIDSNADDTVLTENQEVDLTGPPGSIDINDSGDKSFDNDDTIIKDSESGDKTEENVDAMVNISEEKDPLDNQQNESNDVPMGDLNPIAEDGHNLLNTCNITSQGDDKTKVSENVKDEKIKNSDDKENENSDHEKTSSSDDSKIETDSQMQSNGDDKIISSSNLDDNTNLINEIDAKDEEKSLSQDNDDKAQDSEMSEEMIETLLKGDDGADEDSNSQAINCLDIAEVV